MTARAKPIASLVRSAWCARCDGPMNADTLGCIRCRERCAECGVHPDDAAPLFLLTVEHVHTPERGKPVVLAAAKECSRCWSARVEDERKAKEQTERDRLAKASRRGAN